MKLLNSDYNKKSTPPNTILIRTYKPQDCSQLATLFYDTVHNVNAKDYTKQQLDVWADGAVSLSEWNQSFLKHSTLIAIKENIIAGFGDIDKNGYLDRLYVHKDYQHQGIATALCEKLEHAWDIPKIVTHASITAKPFFEKRGYHVIKEQQVTRKGILLTNYVMEKPSDFNRI